MTMTRRVLALLTGTVVLLVGAGCSRFVTNAEPTAPATASASASPSALPSPTASPTPTVNQAGPLTGVWNGAWTNTDPLPGVGTFVLTWVQQNDKLIGALSVNGSNCLKNGNVTGTVDGNRISFGAVDGSTTVEYIGTMDDSNHLSGSYRTTCGNSVGTWSATRAV